MAARSSEARWRAFLVDLLKKNNAGVGCQLTPRTAFAALSKQFGDVKQSSFAWCKATVYQLNGELHEEQKKKKPTTRKGINGKDWPACVTRGALDSISSRLSVEMDHLTQATVVVAVLYLLQLTLTVAHSYPRTARWSLWFCYSIHALTPCSVLRTVCCSMHTHVF